MSDCAGILRSGGAARRCLCVLIRKLIIRIGNLCINDIIFVVLTLKKTLLLKFGTYSLTILVVPCNFLNHYPELALICYYCFFLHFMFIVCILDSNFLFLLLTNFK